MCYMSFLGAAKRSQRTGYFIKLPKKGSLIECKNWMGVTQLSVPGKAFNRILLESKQDRNSKQPTEEQAEFRSEQSLTDQIATLRLTRTEQPPFFHFHPF